MPRQMQAGARCRMRGDIDGSDDGMMVASSSRVGATSTLEEIDSLRKRHSADVEPHCEASTDTTPTCTRHYSASTAKRRSMARRSSSRMQQLALAVVLVVACMLASAAAAGPAITINRFANLPAKVAYINDATIAFYHDSVKGEVWRSKDEGKSWALVKGPPSGSAYMLVEHPYDRRTVFILSNAKKHWRSSDMGETWHPFDTPEPPAVRAGPPLEFNADEKHYDHIIFTGKKCSSWTPWGGAVCHDEAYYTTDAFATPPKMLVEYLMHCTWAKATKEVTVKEQHLNRIYCIAWEGSPTGGSSAAQRRSSHAYDSPDHLLSARSSDREMRRAATAPTRLFYSDDYFKTKRLVELDIGRDAKNFVGFGPSKRYLVTALRDVGSGTTGPEMALFVSLDGDKWEKALFPHGAGLKEGGYTIIEGTTHSMLVDVIDSTLNSGTGTLFSSDAKGTNFVKSLEGTTRGANGIVDYEHLANIEGVSLANVRADVHLPNSQHHTGIKSLITFNDGSSWSFIAPPAGTCRGKDISECSLHLYSVTRPHNIGRVFSSTAPGFVMGVGSVGDALMPYESCDTFLSTDAGRTWRKASDDAHKYEFGDQGNILLLVDDEESTDTIQYSWNHGKTWTKHNLGVKMRSKILTTIPDSTSQKFLLIGTQARGDAGSGKDRQVAIFIDFAAMKKRKCGDRDMEKWENVGKDSKGGRQCMMGHTQFFQRRKADADCYVGDKFHDPVSRETSCPCTEDDFECDFNFVRNEKRECVPAGRVAIPSGQCLGRAKTFKGPSGYRKVPGDTCDAGKGVSKEGQIDYPCESGAPNDGEVFHQTHDFAAKIQDHIYFSESATIVLQLKSGEVHKSINDGLSWTPVKVPEDWGYPDQRFLTMAAHPYDKQRGYLLTSGQRYLLSTDSGKYWLDIHTAPRPPNTLGIPVLQFHPRKSDWLIWTGTFGDCMTSGSNDCRAVAYYSINNGRSWTKIDEYVRTCQWAAGSAKFNTPDQEAIMCESYRDKKGSQKSFDSSNPLQLILGKNFYRKRTKIFDAIEGYAVFDEFLVVAVYTTASDTLTLMISLDAMHFARAHFPPNTKLEKRAFTVLDSNTGSVFLHGTTHSNAGSEWGALFRSNWNGTYYTLSQEHVNRNARGYVDFEKMLGIEGIALLNVVSNPEQAAISGNKEVQTRITHNDGGRWKALTPPVVDSQGQPYKCNEAGCNLHLHGYTERDDPRATYSSPSAVGLMMAVGNVGKHLAPYKDSDTFLTRDGGFTWEEVHKDAHKWEYGDQGSLIVIVNDEEPTSIVSYTKDEGLTWHDYDFGEKMRVQKILTVPEDTHRKFLLIGSRPSSRETDFTVHLDFTGLTSRRCDRSKDYELWSPSEQANDRCLFGREMSYFRRKRDADCFVGQKIVQSNVQERDCPCTAHDFECEFNHYQDPNDPSRCILYPGATPLPANEEEQCLHSKEADGDYWYDRTSVRKVPHSSCKGGIRPDRGTRRVCSMSTRRHGWFWWLTIVLAPFGLAAVVGMWWNRRQQRLGGGRIRLPMGAGSNGFTNGNGLPVDFNGDNKVIQTLVSVPWFVVGTANMAWSATLNFAERVPAVRGVLSRLGLGSRGSGSYGGYRTLRPHDEDAEILREYDEEELDR